MANQTPSGTPLDFPDIDLFSFFAKRTNRAFPKDKGLRFNPTEWVE